MWIARFDQASAAGGKRPQRLTTPSHACGVFGVSCVGPENVVGAFAIMPSVPSPLEALRMLVCVVLRGFPRAHRSRGCAAFMCVALRLSRALACGLDAIHVPLAPVVASDCKPQRMPRSLHVCVCCVVQPTPMCGTWSRALLVTRNLLVQNASYARRSRKTQSPYSPRTVPVQSPYCPRRPLSIRIPWRFERSAINVR